MYDWALSSVSGRTATVCRGGGSSYNRGSRPSSPAKLSHLGEAGGR